MALVDYTSSDSDSESKSDAEVALKRIKLSSNGSKACAAVGRDVTGGGGGGGGGGDGAKSSKAPARAMPPLPPAFHDLYASTVRVSPNDDPALHQGRKRVNPHKVGNWPTHLYIEWHPTPTERTHLTTLLSDLQTAITTTTNSSPPIQLTSFLTSELSAPQPLHISLSRPIVLTTPQRDPFLASLSAQAVRGSRLRAFDLVPYALAWHRSPETSRTFLVLRVRSTATTTTTATTVTTTASTASREEDPSRHHQQQQKKKKSQNQSSRITRSSTAAAKLTNTTTTTTKPQNSPTTTHPSLPTPPPPPPPPPNLNPNPELSLLLHRCNDLVTSYAQPPLYAAADRPPDPDADPFHVSLAWTFAPPTPELRDLAERVARPFFGAVGAGAQRVEGEKEGEKGKMRIPVDGVKAKIGNVVTHVELPSAVVGKGRGRRRSSGGGGIGEGGGEGGGGNGVLGV
ncbi:U6 snRNA phosphodiesterase Usb1 [Biscogniauxia sp. FL1348]|nr:U6 snRNA phosphodiesterase Usb1 [Biscogniauxia sp. FL1348]